jgi:hypothetical protein
MILLKSNYGFDRVIRENEGIDQAGVQSLFKGRSESPASYNGQDLGALTSRDGEGLLPDVA